MPIPAPERYRRSNLTKQQQQEQLAAVYGVPMAPEQLSAEEIQRMRQILATHDSEHKPMQTVDLNNPPRTGYKFQKFPMIVYDLANSRAGFDEDRPSRNGFGVDKFHVAAKIVSMTVNTEDQLSQALANGWSENAPEFREEREEPLSVQYQNEANRVQERIEETRRHAGRPSNAELARRREASAATA